MNVVKIHPFNGFNGYEMGYGPVGLPIMNVYFYIVDGVMIDTGQSNMKKNFVKILEDKKINFVLLTHYHEDHSGNASTVKSLLNVPVYGHPITGIKKSKKDNILPYQHLIWGKSKIVKVDPFPSKIKSKKYTFVPVHTPGHSRDHTVFFEKNMGWLFSGDLYLGSKIKYFRSDEKILDTINSLKKILKLDFEPIFCAHNPQIKNGKGCIKRKLEYLEDFFDLVVSLRRKGYGISEIEKNLPFKEAKFVKMFTFGNASALNMIRSAVDAFDA